MSLQPVFIVFPSEGFKNKNMIKQFSQKTKEELKVYALIDPRDGKIFYVGKGCENRVFSHINEDFKETEKLKREKIT